MVDVLKLEVDEKIILKLTSSNYFLIGAISMCFHLNIQE